MTLAARGAIAAMPGYAPPREGRRGLRLDFNENTVGCSPAVLAALRSTTAEDLARYPDYAAAESEIAAAFGHTAASAMLTNGVDDAIQLAVMTFLNPGDEAILITPTFAMYRFYCQQGGVAPVEVAYRQRAAGVGAREFHLGLPEVLAAVTARTRAIFLASPNNPTGNLTAREDLLALAHRLPGCLLFVDEAYADFVAPGYRGLLDDAAALPNLLVARTFSKAYGLAGARLGCLFASPALMPGLRKAHSPYNVNALALRCGRAAAGDPAWVSDYCREVSASRALMEAALQQWRIPYWRSAANFVLFEAGERADAWLAGLRQRGILIRDRRQDLPGALRITCGTVAQVRRACSALEELL